MAATKQTVIQKFCEQLPGLTPMLAGISDHNAADYVKAFNGEMEKLEDILNRQEGAVSDDLRLAASVRHSLTNIAKRIAEAAVSVGVDAIPDIALPPEMRESIRQMERKRSSHLVALVSWADQVYTEASRQKMSGVVGDSKSSMDAVFGKGLSGLTPVKEPLISATK